MTKHRNLLALFMFVCIITILFFNVSVYAGDGPAYSEGDDYNVTFYAHVDPEITEITNYVYIGVQNTENHSLYYEYTLYQANNFLLMVQLPEGQYRIVGGGIKNDFSGKYPVEYVTFTVEATKNVLVEFNIGTPDSESAEPISTPELSEDPTSTINSDTENPTAVIEPSSTASNDQNNETKTLSITSVITFILVGIVFIAIIVCIIMVIRRTKYDS